jgi:hypothetical protein
MAEIAHNGKRKGNWLVFEWLAVTEADTFEDLYLNHNVSDILIEAEGTFGAAILTLNGWVVTEAAAFACVSPDGTAISLTADGSAPVRDAFPNFRPVHSGGTSESIDVRIHMKVV